jgi:hypothetical protein
MVGAKLAIKRLKALRFDKETTAHVARLIELHLRFFGYSEGAWSDSAVRRYVRDAGDQLERLHILTRADVKSLDLVEADRAALDCAERNITDPRARFHWADATRFKPAQPWDAVVMNPPFHISRAADPELGAAFLRAAHRGLLPGGTLWLVANRHLPYDRILTPLFRTVEEIGGDAVFRLFRAAHPIRAR